MNIIPLTQAYITGKELPYIRTLLRGKHELSGDGIFTRKVHRWLESRYHTKKALLTTSGTTALELALRLIPLAPGDEVIAPSFTFSSSINAIIAIPGVKVRFADIDPQTFNIHPDEIGKNITKKTRAIMVVHYAGVSADMDRIMMIAKKYKLTVIEDAAQGIESTYKGKPLGTIGDFGCISFHGTKNVTSGEGGALFINTANKKIIEHAEIIREKGTNRNRFLRGLVDKYSWVDWGSSILPSEILAAFLYAQLEEVEKITKLRLQKYDYYVKKLSPHATRFDITLPSLPPYQKHNAHIFYIVLPNRKRRDRIMKHLRRHGIMAAFHYVPLHSAPYGRKMGYKASDLPITEVMSGRLLRLPLYSQITQKDQNLVIDQLTRALAS